MDTLGQSIQSLQARVGPGLRNALRTPLVPYAVTAYVAVRLLKSLSDRLSWYTLNNYITLDKWNPAKELVVVTGGASGIGWQMVQDLVTLKVKVIILDIQEPKGVLPSGVSFYETDITSIQTLKATAAAIRRDHGDPTILINNAGVGGGGTIVDKPEEKIRRAFEVNIMAHFWTVKEFLPAMIRSNHGHVVSIASAASFISVSGSNDYAASKVGVLAFHEVLTQELRHDYGAKAVRTSVIHPLYVRTPMLDAYEKKGLELPKNMLTPQDVSNAVIKQIVTQSSGQVVVPSSSQYLSRLRAFPLWFQEYLRNQVSSKRQKFNRDSQRLAG